MGAFEYGLLEIFLDRTRDDVVRMRRALAQDDRRTIAMLAHRLHGAAGALRMETLSRLGARLDRASEAAHATVSALLDELERAIPGPGGR